MLQKYSIIVLISVLYYFYTICIVNSTPAKNYGHFNLSITKFDVCKGPKSKECGISSARIINNSTLNYAINVIKNVSPTKGKIVAYSNGKEFLRLQVKKPCEHLFLRPLFGALMNVTKDCVVLKGNYNNSINIQDVAKSYFGGTFIFGHWTFKSLFHSEDCNFSCSVIEVILSPLDKDIS